MDKIREIAYELSQLEHERVYLLDGDRVVKSWDGERKTVAHPDLGMFKPKDKILIHNHVDPWTCTISANDLLVALRHNVAETIMVLRSVLYRLRRPTTGWPEGLDTDVYDMADKSYDAGNLTAWMLAQHAFLQSRFGENFWAEPLDNLA